MRRKIKLPKRFTGSSPGLLRPQDWNEMHAALEGMLAELGDLTPKSGSDIGVRQSAGGWVSFLKRRGGGVSGFRSAFCRVYQSGTDWMLLGGTVTGGAGNETIAAVTLGTVGTEPADGIFQWIAASVTGLVEDAVLLPGGDLTAAVPGSGASLPANTIPTASSPAGTLYISLGSWLGGKFIPAACGNIQVAHCPGTLSNYRTTEAPW
jgi:hypothetical protein